MKVIRNTVAKVQITQSQPNRAIGAGMPERFIGEDIKPVVATSDTSRMAAGEPGLPREFLWRGQTVEIVAVLRTWHETGTCSHGSPEKYVRKHWYEVATSSLGTLKIYFERQPRRGRKGSRWRLFTIDGPDEARKEIPSLRQSER